MIDLFYYLITVKLEIQISTFHSVYIFGQCSVLVSILESKSTMLLLLQKIKKALFLIIVQFEVKI